MGIFRDMAGIAAGAAGISARKAKAKKVLDEHRQRAQEELSIHEAAIDDAEVVPLDDAATLLHKLFINLAYDFMEKNGHCTDYIEATDLEKYALRIWMKKYIDQLPEYRYILDDILSQ